MNEPDENDKALAIPLGIYSGTTAGVQQHHSLFQHTVPATAIALAHLPTFIWLPSFADLAHGQSGEISWFH